MNAIITINDYHNTDGQVEKAELTTPAEIYGNEQDYFIIYNEQSEELKGCQTTMHITNGACIEITRKGSYNTEMRMEKGKRSLCSYKTPMGDLMMGIYTTRVESEFSDSKLKMLDFTYSLDFNNELLSKNRIKITAKYKEAN